MFGYKNHVGIDREFGFVRRYTITHAAAYDGGQLSAVLDRDNTASDVWADTAYRLAANLALLERRGLTPQFQRKKPRGRKMPAHIARGNATRDRVRSRVEHVFAAQKCRLGLVVRTVGMVRARAKIGLANLAFNFTRMAWWSNRARMRVHTATHTEKTPHNRFPTPVISPKSAPPVPAASKSSLKSGYSRRPSASSPRP